MRSETTPVGLKNSASMLVAFDGRRPAAHTKIAAMNKKALHQLPQYRGSVFPFGCCTATKSLKWVSTQSHWRRFIASYLYGMYKVGRKFIDLPGTNNTR